MSKFRTQFQRVRLHTCAGSKEHVIYQLESDAEGELGLVPIGKESLYDKIQSEREEADIHVILSRYANGDLSALEARKASFGDLTGVPTNYAEILNACIKGKDIFYMMPKEAREKFDNNFLKFMQSLDDPKALAEKVGVDVAKALGLIGGAAPEKAEAANIEPTGSPVAERPTAAAEGSATGGAQNE